VLTYFCGDVDADQFELYGVLLAEHLPNVSYKLIVEALAADFGAVHGVERDDIKVALLIDEIRKAKDDGGVRATYEQATAMLGQKSSLFISSLQQTDLVEEFVGPSETGSQRQIKLLPLPVLDTYAWCAERGISDELVQRLFALTGGHARTMERIGVCCPAENVQEWAPKWDSFEVQALIRDVATFMAQYAASDLNAWLFPALIGQMIAVDRQSEQSARLVRAVGTGTLMNGVETLGEALIPRVSLFGWWNYAHKAQNVRQLGLLILLFKKREPYLFEQLFALHTSVLLDLFYAKSLEIQLFHGKQGVEQAGQVLFRGAKFIHTPAGANVKKIKLELIAGRLLTIKDDMWKPTSAWTAEQEDECLVPMAGNVTRLLPFDVVYTTAANQAGFDTLMLVEAVDGTRHLVLFELKQIRVAEGNIETKQLVQKIDATSQRMDQLLESPLIAKAGITRHEQVTLCLVTLGGLLRNAEDTLMDAAEAHMFNVVLLNRDALKTHFGPSLAPAIAVCDHMHAHAVDNKA
jgi:hypothetical protein